MTSYIAHYENEIFHRYFTFRSPSFLIPQSTYYPLSSSHILIPNTNKNLLFLLQPLLQINPKIS